jgi:hypothetical protein
MLLSSKKGNWERTASLQIFWEDCKSFSLEQLKRILATDNAHTHANAVNQNFNSDTLKTKGAFACLTIVAEAVGADGPERAQFAKHGWSPGLCSRRRCVPNQQRTH